MEEDFWMEEAVRQKKEAVIEQYEPNLIKAFNAIENIKNKVVKRDALDKYDNIELYAKENKLFRAFTDAALEHIGNMYQDTVSEMSVQDLYYQMESDKGPNRSALPKNKEPRKRKERKTVVPEKTIEKNKEIIKKNSKAT